jgi:CheY-like chemotaxis protein
MPGGLTIRETPKSSSGGGGREASCGPQGGATLAAAPAAWHDQRAGIASPVRGASAEAAHSRGGVGARRPGEEAAHLARPVVLIADDDAIIRGLLVRAIGEELEVAVEAARDGVEALAHARAHPPTVALVDLMMPGVDGLEVTRRLRADPATAGAFVIVMTASGMPAEVAGAAGGDVFMAKPFDLAEVLAVVEAALAGVRVVPT